VGTLVAPMSVSAYKPMKLASLNQKMQTMERKPITAGFSLKPEDKKVK